MFYCNMISLRAASIAICLLCASTYSIAQQSTLQPNDVSWLWPVPTTVDELSNTLSMGELTKPTGTPVWSDRQFQDLLDVVASDATKVGNSRVEFEPEFSVKSNWRIAGMRIDPTAPGAHPALIRAFGSSVQIRLIVQPVTVRGNSVEVHDTAVHLVYSFDKPSDPSNPRVKIPNKEKFEEILDDLRWLKAICFGAGISTDQLPLGVHPGLVQNAPGLTNELRRFLGRHLSADNLSAMAIMGIANRAEPWIFFALSENNGSFGPIPLAAHFAKAQMIDFRSSPGEVQPTPIVSNRPIPGIASPRGVATNVLFGISSTDLQDFAKIGKDDNGVDIRDEVAKNLDIPDIVANPNMSNFFNTDCVSCHTESQQRTSLGLPMGSFAFMANGQSPVRASEVVSAAKWNVRNFGWFPDFFRGGATFPTATQRTANETAEVLLFIKEHYE